MIALARPSLRPYQSELLGRVRARIQSGTRRVVLVAVTGAGKTVMAADMITSAVERARRTLFLAHRTELIDQAGAKLASCGVRHGVIKAGRQGEEAAPVQVASVQTLQRRLMKPRRRSPPGWNGTPAPDALAAFDLVIIDECHHATAAGYRSVLTAYPRSAVVGLTATPYRLDGSGLGDVFQAIEAGPQVSEMLRLGYLVPPRIYAPPPPIELEHLRMRAGDYVISDAERVLDRTAPIAELVESWQHRAAGRTSVGFACSVQHAEHCAEAFRAAGIPSMAIDGATPADVRAQALADLAAHRLRVLWNCMLLTEGWDLPSCSAVLLARPTKSRCLWRQMIGRGLRTADGKTDCVVLDHVGSVYRFGMPDEDDEYSLDGPVKRVGHGGGPLICRECGAIVGKLPCCPECGWVVPILDVRAPRSWDERDPDELQPAQRLTEDYRCRVYWELLSKARERGYQDGWAAHRYRERFGTYPQRVWFDKYQEAAA